MTSPSSPDGVQMSLIEVLQENLETEFVAGLSKINAIPEAVRTDLAILLSTPAVGSADILNVLKKSSSLTENTGNV